MLKDFTLFSSEMARARDWEFCGRFEHVKCYTPGMTYFLPSRRGHGQARKATHGLDGQQQDVDRTLRGRVSQNDGGQG